MKIPPELKDLSKRDLIRLILDLQRRLLAYENAHTPPSQSKNRYPKREPTGNPVGAPKGHKGTTRPAAIPDEIVDVKQETCSSCYHKLGKPMRIITRLIEDIPRPAPIKVTQFNVHAYLCQNCAEINIAKHPELPMHGRFGYSLMAQIAIMKYEDRLPCRKIAAALNRQYNLGLTSAAILSILERVAHSCQPAYESIREHVKSSSNVYADETGYRVQGKQWWVWVFTTLSAALFLFRNSRGQQPVEEAIGSIYSGVLNCDGLNVYPRKVRRLQRCWAHLLREAKLLAQEKQGQAALLYLELCGLFGKVNLLRKQKLALDKRKEQKALLTKQMKMLIGRAKTYRELRTFARKIEHGLEYWFTCVLYPEAEPTNNRAERALREVVVQRKIIGTLRGEKGAHVTEVLMSVLATWRLQGLNTLSMLRQTLSS